MIEHQYADEASPVSQYDYDDRTVLAADFGPGASPSVDVVDGTVIVVDDEQREFDVPAGDVETFTRNGVVTIEVRE